MKKSALFAGGCFWCIESAFKVASKTILKGITDITSGYSGGIIKDPTYQNSGDHKESVQITYDSSKVKYEQLLEIFWQNIDPTDSGGQFGDRGPHYQTAIFYADAEQKRLAEQSKKKISKKFDKPIVTKILKAGEFYTAEEYHQDYSEKNPIRYKLYKAMSGRESFIKEKWGK